MGILSGANRISFAGRDLADFGVYINGNGTFNAPERDARAVSVNGRNGDIIIDNGRYKNIKVKYKAFIVDDFQSNIDALRDFFNSFTGYQRLEDTYHPDEFRLARVSGSFTVKPVDKLYAGEFELVFDCMPQRWLKSGEEAFHWETNSSRTTTITLLNETQQAALPFIHVVMQDFQQMTLSINGVRLSTEFTDAEFYIDAELQEVYTVSMVSLGYSLLDGKFPSLTAGENTVVIKYAGGSGFQVTNDIYFTPRWWRL